MTVGGERTSRFDGALLPPLLVALAAMALVAWDPGGQLANFERRTFDARARAFARTTPVTDRVVIVDVTEESLHRLLPTHGRWPWSRAAHGELVDYLAADGAAAIGFDLLFADAETTHGLDAPAWERLVALAQNADLPEVREELARRLAAAEPGQGDQRFAAAVADAGCVFQAAVFAPGASDEAGPAARARQPPVLVASARAELVRAHALLPFPALAVATRGVGHINATPDPDGTYRRFWPLLWEPGGGRAWPSLGLAIAAHVAGVPLEAVRRAPGGLAVGPLTLPLLDDDSAYVHFQGGVVERDAAGREVFRSVYRHVPYEAVLASAALRAEGQPPLLPDGAFRGKVVLVSAQAAGLSDLRSTPFSGVTPGVEIHANVIDSLLAGRFLRAPRAATSWLALLAPCTLLAVLLARLQLRAGLLFAALVAAGAAGVPFLAFDRGWVLPLVKPLAAVVLATGGVALLRAARAERETRWVRTAFGHYLAPSVLAEVLRSPERLRLGGERRRLTVLFSDVAGFTAFSESMAPEAVSALLNDYLDRMVGCVSQTGGTLDKFVGDAVMAEWNAPLEQADHAARACEAALLMQRELDRNRERWTAACGAPFDVRLGINTGEVVVGNMGSRQIFDYTVLGNEVNTAARLEPLNKTFGTHVIVSGVTRREAEAHAPGRFAFRRLARVMPKGRAAPLEIHELVGLAAALGPEERERLAIFEEGMTHYLERRFEAAQAAFEAVLARAPGDGPASLFTSLCTTLCAQPPEPEWSGVLVQTEK